MNRREALKLISIIGLSPFLENPVSGLSRYLPAGISRHDFGRDFKWGVSTSAYQVEGAYDADGKGPSIWDTFAHGEGNIKTHENGDTTCDFYHRYKEDIRLIRSLNFDCFRFSLSWPRILPSGINQVNQKGIDFYNRVIDECLANGIEPWVTLYHWDLPQELENKGGWTNRDIIQWFGEYADLCSRLYGDRVKNWMILNEPLAFTLTGYMLGMHAPGKISINKFVAAIHHAAMCNSEGARIVRGNVAGGNTGTTFSCSMIEPVDKEEKNVTAAREFDALLNRLFIEPSAGLGYPAADLPFLSRLDKVVKPGDMEKLPFDFDFIGIQNYTREVVKHTGLIPFIQAMPVKPKKRGAEEITEMGWEVYPEGIYQSLKYFARYNPKKIFITENGAAFHDQLSGAKVDDPLRIRFFRDYLSQVLRAKKEGVNVDGYFVWSLLDNFEWAEGFRPRFGIVYVDFETKERFIKNSGYWFREFLAK
jgi:beta-glucosidase